MGAGSCVVRLTRSSTIEKSIPVTDQSGRSEGRATQYRYVCPPDDVANARIPESQSPRTDNAVFKTYVEVVYVNKSSNVQGDMRTNASPPEDLQIGIT